MDHSGWICGWACFVSQPQESHVCPMRETERLAHIERLSHIAGGSLHHHGRTHARFANEPLVGLVRDLLSRCGALEKMTRCTKGSRSRKAPPSHPLAYKRETERFAHSDESETERLALLWKGVAPPLLAWDLPSVLHDRCIPFLSTRRKFAICSMQLL